MDTPRHPNAPEHLQWFITAPTDSDVLYGITSLVVVVSVVLIGVAFFWLHSLPERMSHKKTQFEVVAVLGLISLFTHMHIFWIAGLLLAVIDLPDIVSPLRRIANATTRLAGSGAAPILATPPSLPDSNQPAQQKSADKHSSQIAQPIHATARKRRIATVAALAAVAASILLVMTVDRWFQSPDDASMAVLTKAPEQPRSGTSSEGTQAVTAPATKTGMSDAAAPDEAFVSEAERAQEPAVGKSKPAADPGTEVDAPRPETKPVPAEASQTTVPPATEPATAAEQYPPAETGRELALKVDSAGIDDSGRAVIAGRASPGAEIIAKLNGKPIGRTHSTADGIFVLVPDAPLPKGTSKLTLESRVADGPVATAPAQAVDVNVVPEERTHETGNGATTYAESAAPQEHVPRPAEPILGPTESGDADAMPKRALSEAAAPAQPNRGFVKHGKDHRQKKSVRKKAEPRKLSVAASDGDLPVSSSIAPRTRRLNIVRTWIETRCERRFTHCVTRVRYLRKRVNSRGD